MTDGTRTQICCLALSLLCFSAATSIGTPFCPLAEWTLENPLPAANDMTAIWGSSAIDIYVVGDGIILHFDGYEWISVYDELVYLEGIWGSSPTDVFAVGTIYHNYYTMEGVILHYDGETWTRMPPTIPIRLRGVWGSSDSDVFVVGGKERSSTTTERTGSPWMAGPVPT